MNKAQLRKIKTLTPSESDRPRQLGVRGGTHTMTVRFHDEGEPWFEDVAARVRGLYATELYAQRAIAEAFRLPPSYVAKLMRHCGLLATRSLGHRPHKFDVRHAQPSRR